VTTHNPVFLKTCDRLSETADQVDRLMDVVHKCRAGYADHESPHDANAAICWAVFDDIYRKLTAIQTQIDLAVDDMTEELA
jgi:hypothetical protein